MECVFDEWFSKLLGEKQLLSQTLEKVYQLRPQTHILSEKHADHFFERSQTWDLATDALHYAPVAHSQIRVDLQNSSSLNLDRAHFLEEQEGQIEIEQFLEGHKYPELEQFLFKPYFGRVAKFLIQGKEVATLIEFVSKRPNYKAGLSLFDFICPKSCAENSAACQLQDTLLHIRDFLERTHVEALKALLPQFSAAFINEIAEEIEGVEHMAFILSPHMKRQHLDWLLTLSGFPENHKTFPSNVLAKELGTLVGKSEVSTQIIKAWGKNKKQEPIGVELFIPEEHPETTQKWIQSGVGAHVAFRVKHEGSIERLQKIFEKKGFSIPGFMHGKPMKNPHEGSTTLYFDINVHAHPFRLEFYHKASSISR